MKQISKYLLIAVSLLTLTSGGKAMSQTSQQPTIYFVIFHTPGPQWDKTKSFRQQPGVMKHVEYMSQFLESKKLVMGGPFLDDSGGMMILEAKDVQEAQKIAQDDPTVKSGLLVANVKPWMVAMSR
jgi:uncharacterized protein YciI